MNSEFHASDSLVHRRARSDPPAVFRRCGRVPHFTHRAGITHALLIGQRHSVSRELWSYGMAAGRFTARDGWV